MATVLEAIAAEKKRLKEEEDRKAAIQAQPGPTVGKADLASKARIEQIAQRIAEVIGKVEGGGPSSYIPNTKMLEHGAMLGLDVPLSGLAKGLDFWNEPGSTFSERYQAGEEARRRQLGIARAEAFAPKTQEIVGTILSGGPAGSAERWAAEQAGRRVLPAVQQSLLRSGAEAGGVGAGTGFIHGASTGEGDWRDRILQGGREALTGLVAGSVLGTGARALQPGTNAARARVQAADEFNIPLTRGQATSDIAQQRREQELIHGTQGDAAQRAMRAHQEAVDAARGQAVEDIRSRFSPMRGGTQEESGSLLAESIRRKAERLRAVGGGRIEQALNAGVEIDVPSLGNLRNRVDTALAGPNPQVPKHYIGVNTPVAAEAMRRIDDFMGTLPNNPSARISLAGVNQMRRDLLTMKAKPDNDLDNRALNAIKAEVDNWMNDVVMGTGATGGGVTGPQEALATLRHGNELYRTGSEISHPRGREISPAQRNIEALADLGAIGQDAVRIFKVNQQGGVGAEAVRTARQISSQFGTQSPQMQRVRDIATTSLLEGGPQRVGTQIDNFLTRNRTAAEALFTPEQIAELERFRDTSRMLLAPEGAMNRGQSGYGPMKAVLRSILVGGGAILAPKLGGDVGVLGDIALATGGAAAGEAAGHVLGQRALNRALTPVPGGGPLMPVATSAARVAPGQMPDRDTLSRLLASARGAF